jgi:O-acetyl-ADP-ribose deacetylase (regulator of RNase III)/ribosomal protein S25
MDTEKTQNNEKSKDSSKNNSGVSQDVIEKAKNAILDNGSAALSVIQRSLRIGYAESFKIMRILEKEKFVSPINPKNHRRKILAKNFKPRSNLAKKLEQKTPSVTLDEDVTLFKGKIHTERDDEWEMESIRRQYQERIEFLMKSNKTAEEKVKERRILQSNAFRDPRLPNIFYESKEHAEHMRRIARRLDSIGKEEFLTHPYVLEWSNPDAIQKTWLYAFRADITTLSVDAIVNPTTNSLMGGGRVAEAIHNVAGPELLQECIKIRSKKYPFGLPTGKALITEGYYLPAKYVIHTAGPVWMGGNNNEAKLLYKCYFNSLLLAKKHNIKVIAIPEISVDTSDYPVNQGRMIADKAITDFCAKNPGAVEEIVLIYLI